MKIFKSYINLFIISKVLFFFSFIYKNMQCKQCLKDYTISSYFIFCRICKEHNKLFNKRSIITITRCKGPSLSATNTIGDSGLMFTIRKCSIFNHLQKKNTNSFLHFIHISVLAVWLVPAIFSRTTWCELAL